MLETGIDEKDVKVRAIIDDAISAIIEMDSKRAPADKLKTLVDCSKLIFEALHASSGVYEYCYCGNVGPWPRPSSLLLDL